MSFHVLHFFKEFSHFTFIVKFIDIICSLYHLIILIYCEILLSISDIAVFHSFILMPSNKFLLFFINLYKGAFWALLIFSIKCHLFIYFCSYTYYFCLWFTWISLLLFFSFLILKPT